MSISDEDLQSLLYYVNDAKWVIIITAIALLVFLILIVKTFKKRNAKSNERLRSEIRDYMQVLNNQPYEYSGRIQFNYNHISYSRGNRQANFNINVERNTILAPLLVDEWFQDRNYSAREADKILNDISHFLIEQNFCKNVEIVTDEEYKKILNSDEY